MSSQSPIDISYFPGCSLATTARENNQSLLQFFRRLNINLIELDDWNCCGSSSGTRINTALSFKLCGRNLSLADKQRPLLVACPKCYLRLKETQYHLKNDTNAQNQYQEMWHQEFNADLTILHFFELLKMLLNTGIFKKYTQSLNGLPFVPYYGCMLARPSHLKEKNGNFDGVIESILSTLGAQPLNWSYGARCCGTYLSVCRPDIITPMVNEIMQGAIVSGAECIVTACAMCHLNLEVRCTIKPNLPIIHFSELLAIAFGHSEYGQWFSHHLIDPLPVLNRHVLRGGNI